MCLNPVNAKKNQSRDPPSPCFRFGGLHWAKDCDFANKTCHNCKRVGHKKGYCKNFTGKEKPIPNRSAEGQTMQSPLPPPLLMLHRRHLAESQRLDRYWSHEVAAADDTHRGINRLNRLPFGAKPAPGIFQQYIDALIARLDGTAAFLGLVNFYGTFVKDLPSFRAPLDALTKKDAVYTWTPEAHSSPSLGARKEYLSTVPCKQRILDKQTLSRLIATQPSEPEDYVIAAADADVAVEFTDNCIHLSVSAETIRTARAVDRILKQVIDYTRSGR
ncbi:hypothetical protein ANCCEY_14108 [Ancylostoma ceylanicum]|uniref:Uncharacterized protein n=1 Tax=Ancylostoma ceylanicum TaxID=53326 RepID=A0A0D6LAM9_9BILA|nr:hypothetical protein ANCCEY_14108 [Ancylostoma ceylanicum]